MATLTNLTTSQTIVLVSHHVVGRQPQSSQLILNNPEASRFHAILAYNGEQWTVQDTSANGTFLNDSRLSVDTAAPLKVGDKLCFANADAATWQVQDLAPPQSMLLPETSGTPLIILDTMAFLPNADSPQLTLFQDPTGNWYQETSEGTKVLDNGCKINIGELVWRFVAASNCVETKLANAQNIVNLKDVAVNFNVSQNEEHVELKLQVPEQQFDLGERHHHYLLLLLARQYCDDKTSGVTANEQGWVDKDRLSNMMGENETVINMYIYRFRKQLLKVLPKKCRLPQLIERRKGEVRFTCDNVSIKGGMQFVAVNGQSQNNKYPR
ncbi:MAG: hypothetical protein ACI8WB_003875 [Phenylobacterium sp.]|jgi:hypothetical protein